MDTNLYSDECDNNKSVSYTHLDVYKRQYCCCVVTGFGKLFCVSSTVSTDMTLLSGVSKNIFIARVTLNKGFKLNL